MSFGVVVVAADQVGVVGLMPMDLALAVVGVDTAWGFSLSHQVAVFP